MKRTVFVDTAYLVALLDPKDRANQRALDLTAQLDRDGALLVSTDAVLIELGNYFSRGPLRAEAITWIEEIRAALGWEILPLDRPLVLRGEARYRKQRDKHWSMTDCISMEVMQQQGITDAATLDAHFEQAGFRALMKVAHESGR